VIIEDSIKGREDEVIIENQMLLQLELQWTRNIKISLRYANQGPPETPHRRAIFFKVLSGLSKTASRG